MEGWKGKQATVFYDDGGHVGRKDGVIVNITDIFVELQIGSTTIAIPRERVVRMEVR